MNKEKSLEERVRYIEELLMDRKICCNWKTKFPMGHGCGHGSFYDVGKSRCPYCGEWRYSSYHCPACGE